MRFDYDPYDDLQNIDDFSYQDLSRRIKEYDEVQYSKNSEATRIRKEKDMKTAKISAIIFAVLFLIIGAFTLYIEINLDSLCAQYGIVVSKENRSDAITTIAFNMLLPAIPYIIVLILIGIVAIFIYYMLKAKRNPKSIDDYLKINDMNDDSIIYDGFTPRNFHPESFADPNQKPSPYIAPNNYTSEIMVFLQSTDPEFNSIEFIEWCKKSFRIFWDAWSVGNIEAARIFLGDDLFEKMRSLLQDNLDNNRKDIYKINLLSGCFLNKYERESGFEYLTVYLTSIHRHYTLDSRRNSNIPIEGSISEDLRTTYQLKFTRRFVLDQKTNIQNGIQIVICPNCGAEVTALNAGRCEFCDSVIKTSEFSWVLSDIDEYIRNKTPVDNRGVVIHTEKF